MISPPPMPRIDINSDLAEGAAFDAELMAIVSSANLGCGAHAGDRETIARALRLAKLHGVVVGAHPGHADREHFGRRALALPAEQVRDEIERQLRLLFDLAAEVGVSPSFIKPHGGLYHQACHEPVYGEVLTDVAERFGLALVGLPDCELAKRAEGRVRYVAEGFADRRYRPDGSLVPRSEPSAMIEDVAEAVAQVERLATDGRVETICIHGDCLQAVHFAQAVRIALEARGWRIRSVVS